jgi:hypothetical protein
LEKEADRNLMSVTGSSQPSVCRVCGGRPTINAHLFPRALGHDLRGREKHLYVGGAEAPGRRIVQAGLSDRRILCSAHEAALGVYDDYGIEFCRTFSSKVQHPAPNIWRVRDVDGDRLTRFWLAVLWRFGVSTLPEAAMVQLGPYEGRLRDILFSNAPCSIEPAVTMLRYRSHVMPPENICFTPYASHFPPLRLKAHGMAVSGFHAFVKLDRQPLPHLSHMATVNGKSEVNGGYLQLEATQQFQRLRQIAKQMSLKANTRYQEPGGAAQPEESGPALEARGHRTARLQFS